MICSPEIKILKFHFVDMDFGLKNIGSFMVDIDWRWSSWKTPSTQEDYVEKDSSQRSTDTATIELREKQDSYSLLDLRFLFRLRLGVYS